MEEDIIVENQEEKRFSIDWQVPEGLITPFATNMVIQKLENVFKIMFFEAKPPIRLDKSEPMPEKIKADYVGSIIVTPEKLSTFVDIFKKQLDLLKLKK